jgi:membrane associated rhomboid family serine protease
MLASSAPAPRTTTPGGAPASDPHAGRIDFERGMTYAPPLTLGLLGLLTAVFVWQVTSGSLASADAVIASGALVRERCLAGEWWRMLTATGLHGGPDHLIGNAMSLYVLGMACEHAFGSARYAGVYVASGLGGSALSMLLAPGPSVGASGAIFGLMGAIVAHLIKHQDRFYVRDKRIGIVLLVWALFILAQGLASPFIDNGAHLGGFLAGIAAGIVVPSRLLEGGAFGSARPGVAGTPVRPRPPAR